MRTCSARAVGALVVAFGFGLGAQAADKPEALILGKWEIIDGKDKLVQEFSKDGKWWMTMTIQGESLKTVGRYKIIKDDTLETTFSDQGKDVTKTCKIIKITEEELVLKYPKDKEPEKWKRAK
jgi:uncharacterized protein (TIGR03066 family)